MLEDAVPGMMPSRYFHDEVHIEMLRSDRTASPMTLLLFDLENPPHRPAMIDSALEKLAGIVRDRARGTDRCGWYREDDRLRVGLILHHTDAECAESVIETIRSQFHTLVNSNGVSVALGRVEISCEIYGYPCDAKQEGSSHEQLWLFDEATLAGLEPSEDPASGGRHLNGSRSNGNGSQPGRNGSGGGRNGAHSESNQSGHSVATFDPIHTDAASELLGKPLPRWKRAIDVIGSGTGLLFISPLVILSAIAVKLTSKGPILFGQERVGYRGRTFKCWKFRTMIVDQDQSSHQKYLESLIEHSANTAGDDGQALTKLDGHDPRITFVGNILRKTCIDEIPQLFNVLTGEMSLIGPRPCLPYEAEKYLHWHKRRFDTIPGMTGLWQVSGKNKTTFKEMIRYDINYARNCSFGLDVKILFLTIPAVFTEIREGFGRKLASSKATGKDSTGADTAASAEVDHVQQA